MKFGRKISADLYNEWRPYYLDYNGLKNELKNRTEGRDWVDKDEQEFIDLLEVQLDKIHDFQKAKTMELSRRIRDAEKDVQRLVDEEYTFEDSDSSPHDPESQVMNSYGPDPGSDDESEDGHHSSSGQSYDAFEDRFHGLEEEVATLVADVHDLALYTKLNITGFMKILKKHDKKTGRPLKTGFIQDYLETKPFYKYNWDALIVKLSHLYNLVRTRGHPVAGDSSAGGSQSAFVRQTTKYWVHPDNLVPLKLAVLRHLPVLVFNPDKEFDQKDAAITSIYFDNEDLELYLGRLEKTEGAEAIRLRWYGDMDVRTIFVERKTHREDWTGEKSVKARFPIKENLVNSFLRGEYTMDEEFQALVKKGKKTQAEVDSMIQLAAEVQYAVISRKLQPVMRTFYNRTAFQLPGDARVRISLDTELTMVREDNWDGVQRHKDNWRRMDIGIDHPFAQLEPEDKELFKYGVLEVKLQTQFGQEPPRWVMDLVNSHLVEAVPKFSKFIHGCSTLLPNRVDLIPFWLPQMDTDILKPNQGYLSVARPANTSSKGTSDQTSSSSGVNTPENLAPPRYSEPVSDGEEDEDMDRAPAKDADLRTGLSYKDVAEANAYREKMLKEIEEACENEEDASHLKPYLRGRQTGQPLTIGKPRGADIQIDPLASASAFDATLRQQLRKAESVARDSIGDNSHSQKTDGETIGLANNSLEDLEDPHSSGINTTAPEFVNNFLAPAGKRVSIPVRVEPKVYFAAERTFLKWLDFSVLISAIATTLLNFISPQDYAGLICAVMFTIAALLAIAYSAGVFIYRTLRLRSKSATGMYYDKWGPSMLCVVLIASIGVNVVLRMTEMSRLP